MRFIVIQIVNMSASYSEADYGGAAILILNLPIDCVD